MISRLSNSLQMRNGQEKARHQRLTRVFASKFRATRRPGRAKRPFLRTTLNCNRLTALAQYLVVGVSRKVISTAPCVDPFGLGHGEISKIPGISGDALAGGRDHLVV